MGKLDRSLYGQPSLQQVNDSLQRSGKSLSHLISFGKTNANSTPQAPDASNIDCFKATGVTPGAANTEFSIAHNLLWVPWFYFYILDRGGNLYQLPTTGTAWTAATPGGGANGNIFLKCSVVSANYSIIII